MSPAREVISKRVLVRLKNARQAAGLTQTQAAQRLQGYGWTQTAISKIERGERELLAAELYEFSVLYEKPLTYFFTDD